MKFWVMTWNEIDIIKSLWEVQHKKELEVENFMKNKQRKIKKTENKGNTHEMIGIELLQKN